MRVFCKTSGTRYMVGGRFVTGVCEAHTVSCCVLLRLSSSPEPLCTSVPSHLPPPCVLLLPLRISSA